MACVFDTSVLICVIKREAGFETALENLQEKVYMSAVNLAEFSAWIFLQSNLASTDINQLIENLEIEIIDFDLTLALNCGKLIKETKKYGLSLGDRSCIALGQKLNLPVLTLDKIWQNLDIDCQIQILR